MMPGIWGNRSNYWANDQIYVKWSSDKNRHGRSLELLIKSGSDIEE
jgi:hypothetical protein